MQTHDEGEPWQDYVPPSNPTAIDPALTALRRDYAALHSATLALIRFWENYLHENTGYTPLQFIRVSSEMLRRIADLLRKGAQG